MFRFGVETSLPPLLVDTRIDILAQYTLPHHASLCETSALRLPLLLDRFVHRAPEELWPSVVGTIEFKRRRLVDDDFYAGHSSARGQQAHEE